MPLSYRPTLPSIRPAELSQGSASVSQYSNTPVPGTESLSDPTFGNVTGFEALPFFSTNSPTFLSDSTDGVNAVTGNAGWYMPTISTGIVWTGDLGGGYKGLESVRVVNSSAVAPTVRPRAYDSTGNPIGGLAARSLPNDYYRFNIYAKTAIVTGTPQIGLQVKWADETASTVAHASTATMVNLGTTWSQVEIEGFAPETVPGSTGIPIAHMVPEVVFGVGSTGVINSWYLSAASLALDTVRQESRTADFSDQRATLSTGTGGSKWVAPVDLRIVGVRAALDESPTGQDFIVDINKNTTTIYATQGNRPRVVDADADGVGAVTVPDTISMTAGEYLTVDIDQVGSGTPGGKLSVMVEWSHPDVNY